MAGHRFGGAYLGLSHSQNSFLITMVHFYLPAIKINLNQRFGAAGTVGAQQISRLAVVDTRMRRRLVRRGGDDDQSQPACATATLPQYPFELFVFDATPIASKVNPGFLPTHLFIFVLLFRGKSLWVIFAARAGSSRPAKASIFATACNQIDAVQWISKQGSIAKAPVHGQSQRAINVSHAIQAAAKAGNHLQGLSGKIDLYYQLAIMLSFFLCAAL